MNYIWLDIEEYLNNKFQLGFLIIDNEKKEIRGYETFLSEKENINDILVENKISKIFVFNENDSTYLKKLNFVNDNCEIINVFSNYQKLVNGTKLQLSKNSDIAKASGIKINYNRLHSPLYDIQLSYCSFHNYSISDVNKQMDMLYDSFFVLTGKMDIYWSLIKSWNININNIDIQSIIPYRYNNRYFMDGSNISNNIISFIEYDTLEKISFVINSENIQTIINFFKTNIILFLNAKDQKELSKKIWNITYYSNIRYNNKIPLYIFFGINLSRFKNRIDNYSIENIKEQLSNELSFDNLVRINGEE